MHGAVRGRHAPGPGPQRPLSQPKQHGCPPPELQSSPVGRQRATPSTRQRESLQTPEQHSASAAHESPTRAQSRSAQTPPTQPVEQHSCAEVHAAPAALQSGAHARFVVPGAGSHRALQHSADAPQAAPALRHVPEGRHTLDSQRPEQHSASSWQA